MKLRFLLSILSLLLISCEKDGGPSSYNIGDYYNKNGKEGVVFWVDHTGQHGKIVSLIESGKLEWASGENEQTKAIGANDKDNGTNNMKVVKNISGWQSKYPAFAWCYNLGDDWYLPAINELMQFTLDKTVLNIINQTLAEKGVKILENAPNGGIHWYWSSTEESKYNKSGYYYARFVDIRDGGKYIYGPKFNDIHVRAITTF